MSCNEWEKGTIVIPKAQWATFKKTLRDSYAKAQLADFELALKVLKAVKDKFAGQRGVDWRKAIETEAYRTQTTGYWGGRAHVYPFQTLDREDLCDRHLTVRDEKTGKVRLRTPLKKDFCTVNSKTMSLRADYEGSVHFLDDKHAVYWSVSENNHAVDNARESFVAKHLFKLLDGVKWARGSGGVIYGNNEYNRDEGRDGPGRGESYIVTAYGPLGEKEQDAVNPCLAKIRRRKRAATSAVRR